VRHPIVGDSTYANLRLPKGAAPELADALRGFRRQALHAERLEFRHPADGREVVVEVARPADMEALVGVLRDDAKS
jgi:23S rRNA pseudouridine1911/1915/1917 synthase